MTMRRLTVDLTHKKGEVLNMDIKQHTTDCDDRQGALTIRTKARADTFPQFVRLPLDIQYFFWEQMVEWVGPCTFNNGKRQSYFNRLDTATRFTVQYKPVPSVLQICALSRTIASLHYNPVLVDLMNGRYIRFDARRDSLCLELTEFIKMVVIDGLNRRGNTNHSANVRNIVESRCEDIRLSHQLSRGGRAKVVIACMPGAREWEGGNILPEMRFRQRVNRDLVKVNHIIAKEVNQELELVCFENVEDIQGVLEDSIKEEEQRGWAY